MDEAKKVDRKNGWVKEYCKNRVSFEGLYASIAPLLQGVMIKIGICEHSAVDDLAELVERLNELEDLYYAAGFLNVDDPSGCWDEESLRNWESLELSDKGDNEYPREEIDVVDEISNIHMFVKEWGGIYCDVFVDLDKAIAQHSGVEGKSAIRVLKNLSCEWCKLVDAALAL